MNRVKIENVTLTNQFPTQTPDLLVTGPTGQVRLRPLEAIIIATEVGDRIEVRNAPTMNPVMVGTLAKI